MKENKDIFKHKFRILGDNNRLYYIIGRKDNSIANKRMEMLIKEVKEWDYIPPNSYFLLLKTNIKNEMKNVRGYSSPPAMDDSDDDDDELEEYWNRHCDYT